jgi:ketosteroid isomerase-like protein
MTGFSGRGLRSLLVAVGAAGLVLGAACAPVVDTAAIAKTLTQLDDDWSKAAAIRNADSVASFYADDAIAYPPNMPMAVGKAAAKAVWAAGFADSTYKISWKTLHAGASKSGDLGYTTGTYEESFVGPDGKLVTAGRPFTTAGTRTPSRSITVGEGRQCWRAARCRPALRPLRPADRIDEVPSRQ